MYLDNTDIMNFLLNLSVVIQVIVVGSNIYIDTKSESNAIRIQFNFLFSYV